MTKYMVGEKNAIVARSVEEVEKILERLLYQPLFITDIPVRVCDEKIDRLEEKIH